MPDMDGSATNLIGYRVIVCQADNQSSVETMISRNEWGYVRYNLENSHSFGFALYEAEPVKEITYFAVVKKVMRPDDLHYQYRETQLARDAVVEKKRVILFQERTLAKLAKPIPFGTVKFYGSRYTTLKKFLEADSTDDLWD